MSENRIDNEIDYIAIGEQIRKARIKANMTQDDLAEEIGISSGNYISNIERGSKHASFDILLKIAKALKTRLDTFLEKEYEGDVLDNLLMQEIALLISSVSQERKSEYLKLIKKLAEGFEELNREEMN